MNSDLEINTGGNNGLYTILLFSRSVSIDIILTFFSLQIDSKKLKTRFLGHNANLMLNTSANSLKIISLSINYILDTVSRPFNEFNTIFNSFDLKINDFSSLINLSISIIISDTQIFSSILSSI